MGCMTALYSGLVVVFVTAISVPIFMGSKAMYLFIFFPNGKCATGFPIKSAPRMAGKRESTEPKPTWRLLSRFHRINQRLHFHLNVLTLKGTLIPPAIAQLQARAS